MSFQQGLSGLNASSKNLEVIGNNVANANTIGAKGSRAEFGDMYAAAINGQSIGIGVNLQAVTLDPALAALFGTKLVFVPLYTKSTNSSGYAGLVRQFKRASLSFQYERAVNPGNGVYLASRVDSGTARLSYTALRKLNFGVDGGYYGLTGKPVQQFSSVSRVRTARGGASMLNIM